MNETVINRKNSSTYWGKATGAGRKSLLARIVSSVVATIMAISMTAIPVSAQENCSADCENVCVADEIIAHPGELGLDQQNADAEQAKEVPLYFQTDYPNDRYGYGTVASSGCGITSLAMVATYMTGHPYMPDELAAYFGGHGENNIQRLEYASDMLQLPWKRAENVHEVFSALQEGNVAIVLMNAQSIFTSFQHFVVLTEYTEDGKIMVHDPYRPNYDYWLLKNGLMNGFEEGDIICGYDGGWVYDPKAMGEDPFVYAEEEIFVEPRYPQLELTWEEQQLMAKIVWAEARGECAEGQQAVAEVILNRMASAGFPSSLNSVIFAEGQFRSVDYLDEATPTQAQYEAVDRALKGPYVLPMDVVHFATYPVNASIWGKIGGHVFCYQYGS